MAERKQATKPSAKKKATKKATSPKAAAKKTTASKTAAVAAVKSTKKPVEKKVVAKKAKKEKKARTPRKWTKPFRAIGGYFRGAWVELRQVRWPDRKTTWGMTIAVLLFSVAFSLIILGLDTLFNYIFKEVIL